MAPAEISISNSGDSYYVRVSGRATFEQAPQLRSLAKSLDSVPFTSISVDLGGCTGMDSTFMGILAMLGLRARKINAKMTVFNAGDFNQNLLFGLGLKKLFAFENGNMDAGSAWSQGESASNGMNAETVLEAHKTLMDADEGNIKKFEKVVELVQKDIDSKKS